ncbi:MAG: DUF1684 domain-containing protein [Actinomycetota bacterium]
MSEEAHTAGDILDLLDWRRRVAALYSDIRASEEPEKAWWRWREVRDELLGSHPQSPLPSDTRAGFEGLAYFDYDPTYRVTGEIEAAEPQRFELPGSAGETFGATRFARAAFRLEGQDLALGMYWLDGYAGGLFVSFRDETSGRETYGACRYLLDTVKGADLGSEGASLILDFNFAYNPSCSYDPRWACPLAPPDNRLPIAVTAGERHG